MTGALAVYIGEKMRRNFGIAVDAGTWGCPVPQTANLEIGDTVLFVGQVPGGPRQTGGRPLDPSGVEMDDKRSWLTRSAGFCWTATATSTWFEDDSSIWEPHPDPYRFRFTFSDALDRGSLSLAADVDLTREASLAVKLAALQVKNGGLQCQRIPQGAVLLSEGGSAELVEVEVSAANFEGDLSVPTSVLARAEQAELRRRLLRSDSACALCGSVLPGEFLVAAHIKKRSLCTDAERRDLDNIAMLACKLGCDAAFELGVLVVDSSGAVQINVSTPFERIPERFIEVAGRQCLAHRPETEEYFAWHRKHHGAA